MSRILAIRGTEVDREVDYSSLTLKEIQKKIKGFRMTAIPTVQRLIAVAHKKRIK